MANLCEGNILDEMRAPSADQEFGSSQSWTCCACGRTDITGEECADCGVPRLPVRSVKPDSAEIDRMLEEISAEPSTIQSFSEAVFVSNETNGSSIINEEEMACSMNMSVAKVGSACHTLASPSMMESSVSSISGSIFEETPYLGIFRSELRGINHFPLSESTLSEIAAEAPAGQQQTRPQSLSSCLPGQELNGPGTIDGSETVVWRCLHCRIVNSVRDTDCAHCHIKRRDTMTLDAALDLVHPGAHLTTAIVALGVIADACPRTLTTTFEQRSNIIEFLHIHARQSLEIAEIGLAALEVMLQNWICGNTIAFQGGFDLLCALMLQYTDSQIVATHGCSIICNDFGHENSIIKAGGIQAVIITLRRHANSAEVCQIACRAISMLAREDNRLAITNAGGIADVLSVIVCHGTTVKVMENALFTLCQLSKCTICAQVLADGKGGTQTVLSALKSHSSNANIAKYCFKILTNLLNTREHLQPLIDAVADSGGIELILIALKSCLCNVEATTVGSLMVYSLCFKDVSHQLCLLVSQEGLETMLACLCRHADASPLCTFHVLAALSALLAVRENSITAANTGAIVMMSMVLLHYVHDISICSVGCRALGHFAHIVELSDKFLNEGGIAALFCVAKVHEGNSEVGKHICNAIGGFVQMTQHGRHTSVLLEKGIIEVMLNAMRTNAETAEIASVACFVLNRLVANSPQVCPSIVSFDGVGIITAAICTHLVDDKVVMRGCQVLQAIGPGACCSNDICLDAMFSIVRNPCRNQKIVQSVSKLLSCLIEDNMDIEVTADRINALLAMLRVHLNDTVVVENGCAVLSWLCRQADCKYVISSLGGVDVILSVLSMDNLRINVVSKACIVLAHLARLPANWSDMAENRGIELMLATLCSPINTLIKMAPNELLALSIKSNDARTQATIAGNCGFRPFVSELLELTTHVADCLLPALINLADVPKYCATMIEAGGVPQLVAALKFHNHSAQIVCWINELLQNLSVENSHRDHFVKCIGITEELVRNLDTYRGSATVVIRTCGLLRNLLHSNKVCLAMIAADGFQCVFAVMRAHQYDVEVIEEASCVVSMLTQRMYSEVDDLTLNRNQNECAGFLNQVLDMLRRQSDHNMEKFVAICGGVDILVSCMVACDDNAPIIYHCCAALFNLSVHCTETCVRIAKEVPMLCSKLRGHLNNAKVIQMGLILLQTIVVAVTDFNVGIDELLFLSIRAHYSNATIVQRACHTLCCLSSRHHTIAVNETRVESMLSMLMPTAFGSYAILCELGFTILLHVMPANLFSCLVGEGALQGILQTILDNKGNSSVAQRASSFLRHLSSCPEFGTSAGNADCVLCVFSLMRIHQSDCIVAVHCLATLWNLVQFADCLDAFDEKGVYVLLTTMRAHIMVYDAAEYGCCVLNSICTDNKPLLKAVGNAHGWRTIVACMDAHDMVTSIVEHACSLLNKLAVSCAPDAICCVESVLAAIRGNFNNERVVEEACSILQQLSLVPSNRNNIADCNGVYTIVSSMRAHFRCAPIVHHGCMTLRNLAGSIKAIAAIMESSGTDLILLLLSLTRHHMDSAEVSTSACLLLLLRLIDGSSAHQSNFLHNGGMKLMLELLTTTNLSERSLEAACNILWIVVGNCADNRKLLLKAGGCSILKAVVHGHSSNCSIVNTASAILNSLPKGWWYA